MDKKVETIIRIIEEAFLGVKCPPENKFLHKDCIDDMDIKSFYGKNYKDWKEVESSLIEQENAALCFASPEFYQFLLPAYMIQGIKNPKASAILDSTIYSLSADIEKWASGLKRIYDECTTAGIKVEFKRVKTGFVVSFHRPKWEEGEGLEKGGQKSKGKSKVKSKGKVIEIIAQNSSVTIPEIASALDMSIAGIEKIIRVLKKEDKLRRAGPDKGGHWEIFD